ncbi:MAG TPA: efflux RND transporter permease subunit [Balneolaceae bacterium]|nr:efflux RND transporter permease subunit [Balneolaceae bacterium]
MKKFSITGNILRRPVTVIMATLIVIGFGIFALTNLKVTLRPSFNIPVLAVSVNYQNVAPKDMEQIVVDPIAGAVSSVEGIKTLESHISKGHAFIILRLYDGTNVRKTEEDVRANISRIRNQLPNEVNNPVIFQFDPENFPIMHLSLKSSTRGLDKLRELSTNLIEPRLERLDGVASADTRGGLERTIFVDVNPGSLAQYNMVPSDIENALRNNNVEVPIGNIVTRKNSYSIEAQSRYQNINQIRQTIIKMSQSGVPIRIKDVAKVKNSFADINTLVDINGKNSVSIEIHKKSDANTLDATSAVRAALPKINADLPPGVTLSVLSSDGKYIQQSISNLAQTAFAALIVVIIVLLIVMGGWRIALVVGATIPLSVTASFAGMYAFGLTLNTLTISALALAVGLLVDNAIVVSESIARKLEEGLPKFQAALQGTNEVIGALLGATLTTLGIFLPIISLSGVVGQLFRSFALTICIAIAISFIAAIILVPVLTLLFINKSQFEDQNWTGRFVKKLERWYASSLRWLMFHKWTAVIAVIALIGGIYVIYHHLPSQFFAQSDSGSVSVDIKLPEGTKLTRTANVMHRFSKQIQNMPVVKTVITEIGQRGFRSQTNEGEIDVNLVDQSKRSITTQAFSLRLRKMLRAPGVDVNIQNRGHHGGFGGGGGGGIRLSIIGPDIDKLLAISDKIKTLLKNDPNVISIDNGRSDPTPELHYLVDRQRISRMNSSLSKVANSLKTQVQGTRVGYYRDQNLRIPIRVRVAKNAIRNRQDLAGLQLIQVGNQRIPVTGLGHFISTKGVDDIQRRNRQTVMDLSINVKGNAMQYRKKILSTIKNNIVLPDGYRYSFTGSTHQARQSTSEIKWALLFAILLTYMIMASLFENFRDPFVIFFAIPLAFFGAFAGLFLTNTPLSSTAFIGIFILVGIIVNNGIVLVDYMHLYTKNNEYTDSYLNNIIEACKRRMRPVLLTALTTICSMIPLSIGIGTGAGNWAPLGRTVIGGLFVGSILTLYIIPIFVMGISKERRKAINESKNE